MIKSFDIQWKLQTIRAHALDARRARIMAIFRGAGPEPSGLAEGIRQWLVSAHMRARLHRLIGVVAALGSPFSAWALGPYQPGHVWPLSGTSTPDLPASSSFGPRLQASAGYVYDFHRGIDLPTSYGTPVRASHNGYVRIAGNTPSYSDPLVQLRHYKPGSTSCSNGGCYYTNYMHLSSWVVTAGQNVLKGNVIGFSGESVSGFPHLHFEVRDAGLYQQNCVHPLLTLPYANPSAPEVAINWVDAGNPAQPSVDVKVTASPAEVDINRIEVFLYDTTSGSDVLLGSKAFDYNGWNLLYTPTDNPNQYLDDPNFNGVNVRPAQFNASSASYRVDFTFFSGLPSIPNPGAFKVRAVVTDVLGSSSEAIK